MLGWNVFCQAKKKFTVLGTHNEKTKPVMGADIKRLNIEQRERVMEVIIRFQPQVIIHCSAICALGHCEKSPERAYQVNVSATKNLLEAAKTLDAQMIFVSTDLVFDGRNPPYQETDQPKPLSVYGKTKIKAEDLVLDYSSRHLIARCALSFGQSVQGKKGASDWILDRISKGQPVTLYHDEFRSPLEGSLMSEILLKLAFSSLSGIIHIGGRDTLSRLELGKKLLIHRGLPPELLISDSRLNAPWPPRPWNLSFNCTKLEKFLGKSLPGIEDSLTGINEIKN